MRQPVWAELHASGNLLSLVGDVMRTAWLRRRLEARFRSARSVMIIDDGEHKAPDLIEHFSYLSKFVTVGNYYLLQDSRLDFDCACGAAAARTRVFRSAFSISSDRRSRPCGGRLAAHQGYALGLLR